MGTGESDTRGDVMTLLVRMLRVVLAFGCFGRLGRHGRIDINDDPTYPPRAQVGRVKGKTDG